MKFFKLNGNTYANRCLLESAGVEEDTEAELTEKGCIFG